MVLRVPFCIFRIERLIFTFVLLKDNSKVENTAVQAVILLGLNVSLIIGSFVLVRKFFHSTFFVLHFHENIAVLNDFSPVRYSVVNKARRPTPSHQTPSLHPLLIPHQRNDGKPWRWKSRIAEQF